MRLALPFVLLALVYVPLRGALNEVAWQIRVRSAVNATLGRLSSRLVHSRMRIERGEVDVRILVVGTPDEAEKIQAQLSLDLTKVSGVTVGVEVLAVPDARTLSGLTAKLRDASLHEQPAVPEPQPSPVDHLNVGAASVVQLMGEIWPANRVGAPAEVWLSVSPGPLRIAVAHIGPALDAAASDVIARSLTKSLEREVALEDLAIPVEVPIDVATFEPSQLGRALAIARMSPKISVCVGKPPAPVGRGKVAADHATIENRIASLVNTLPRISWLDADAWGVWFAMGSCDTSAPTEPTGPHERAKE